MKPQTLIPLSEYVDKVREIPKTLSKDKLKLIYDFSDKLKQPPTIADFIPSVYESGVWMVLEKPKPQDFSGKHKHWVQKFREAESQYQTALNNVKFSGWEFHDSLGTKKVYVKNKINDNIIVFFNGICLGYEIISSLTTLNLPLTERGITHFNINI